MIAATNRPFDLDEAALRRLTKRIYISLPDQEARLGIIKKQLKGVQTSLSSQDLAQIAQATKHYSSADLAALCKEAAMIPVREIPTNQILKLKDQNSFRKISGSDFAKAMKIVCPSVSPQTILEY